MKFDFMEHFRWRSTQYAMRAKDADIMIQTVLKNLTAGRTKRSKRDVIVARS